MSILDDAIREHLELKRAHGADEAELKKLEDEAFGPPARPGEPDPFAEAPTEFLVAPETEAEPEISAGEADELGGRRVPNIADLQEAPAPAEQPEPAPRAEEPAAAPAEEEHPAAEHEAIAESGHSTEERHAIAEQPTELFDVEGEFEGAESNAPSDEELAEAELAEPRLAPVDPLSGIEASGPAEPEAPAAEEEPVDEFDEFFSEQRLSDELNQALEAPLPDEPGAPPTDEEAVYVDADEDEGDDLELEDAAPEDHAPTQPNDFEDAEPPTTARSTSAHEDVLEDTPDFLEDAPEDDELWFEQKPPKDIDFGD